MNPRVLKLLGASCALAFVTSLTVSSAQAASREVFNGCRTTADNPCVREGTCSIQGSTWYAYATIDRSEKFDTQGWTGLCDMMHVALVQGTCEPLGSQIDVFISLSDLSYAFTPEIAGSLTCGGDSGGGDSGGGGGGRGGRPQR